ncbi:MAG: hypothetical protein WCK29_02295 [archaeon]
MFGNLFAHKEHSFDPKLYLELSYFPTTGEPDISRIKPFIEKYLLRRYEVVQSGLLMPLVNHAGVQFIRGGLDLDSSFDALVRVPICPVNPTSKDKLLELRVFYQDFSSEGKLTLHHDYSLSIGTKPEESPREAEALAAKNNLYENMLRSPLRELDLSKIRQ